MSPAQPVASSPALPTADCARGEDASARDPGAQVGVLLAQAMAAEFMLPLAGWLEMGWLERMRVLLECVSIRRRVMCNHLVITVWHSKNGDANWDA